MESSDQFTPSTTEPVFGSGLITQAKSHLITNNDTGESEKVSVPSDPITNGDKNDVESHDNTNNNNTEAVAENADAPNDSKVEPVDDSSEQTNINATNHIKSTEESNVFEQSNQVESIVPSNGPEPMLTTPADIANEGLSSITSTTVDSKSAPVVEEETKVEEAVPQLPAVEELKTTEPKSKAPRGKAKASEVSSTRQSTRGRKTAAISSINTEENQKTDDTVALPLTTAAEHESSKRTKRQAATIAKDAIKASNQPNSTSGSSIGDDGNDQDVIPSDGDDDDDVTHGKTKRSSSSGRRKRGASTSPATAAKKAKAKTVNNIDNDTEAPPKKPRTSVTKKAPEQPSEEYVRKLRPRK